MLHKKFFALALGLVAALSFGMSAMAQDDEGVVPILEDGDEIDGVLSLDVQAVAYIFNGNEGDEVTVTMETDDDNLDTFLVVIGTDGVLLASNDDAGGTDVSEIEAELPTTGSYIIIASSYIFIDNILEYEGDEDAEMEFTVSLSGNTPVEELGDAFALTFEEMGDGDSFDGEIDEDVHAMFYVFSGEEGDEINISMETEDFPSVIHVFGPNGERVALGNGVEDQTYSSAIEGLELPMDGSYLIVATDIFFYSALNEDEEDIPYTGGEFSIELSFE